MSLSVNQFGTEQTAPSHRYGPHVRDHYLIHYVLSGKGTLKAEGLTHAIGAGEAFVIFPGQLTLYQADAITPWHYGWVGFHGEEAEALLRKAGVAPDRPVIRCHHNLFPILQQMSQDIGLSEGPLALTGGLMRFLALLFDRQEHAKTTARSLYEKAVWYFRGNYPRPITIAETARFVSLSRSQLFRVFVEECGKSPKQALTALRLEEAYRLLLSTRLTVQVVAYAVGIPSASRFCALFLEQYGQTPGQFVRTKAALKPGSMGNI